MSYFLIINQSLHFADTTWCRLLLCLLCGLRHYGCFRLKCLNHPKNCSRQGSVEMHKQLLFDWNPVLARIRISCARDILEESFAMIWFLSRSESSIECWLVEDSYCYCNNLGLSQSSATSVTSRFLLQLWELFEALRKEGARTCVRIHVKQSHNWGHLWL